jgi:hypothetical protein
MSQVNGDHPSLYQVFPNLSPEEFNLLKRLCDLWSGCLALRYEVPGL